MSTDFQTQIDALWTAVRKLEQTAAEYAASTAAPSATPRMEIIARNAMAELPGAIQSSTDIPPEVEAAIKATLSAVLGHEVRIRSMTLVEKADAPSSWTTQGRVAQQSSHNQRTTRG